MHLNTQVEFLQKLHAQHFRIHDQLLKLLKHPLRLIPIEKAINIKAELPSALAFILDEKENYDILENNLNKIKQHIKERI